jgi:hypothetical protein
MLNIKSIAVRTALKRGSDRYARPVFSGVTMEFTLP